VAVDVVVAGAGVAGLAAAHRLRETGASVEVLESEDVAGGRARSERWGGSLIELGAVYLTPSYRELLRLVRKAALEEELRAVPRAFRSAVRRDGEWHEVDYTSPAAALRFGGIGWCDRASLSLVMIAAARAPRMRFGDLTSVARLDGRRLDEVVTDAAARVYTSPIIELFCGYRPEDVTLALTAMAVRFSGKPLGLARGTGSLTGRLAEQLDVRTGERVTEVRTNGDGVAVRHEERWTDARAAIVALPADVAKDVWSDAPDQVRSYLGTVDYGDGFSLYLRVTGSVEGADRLYMQLLPEGEHDGVLHALGFIGAAPDGGYVLRAEATATARSSIPRDELAERLEREVLELHPGCVVAARRVAVAPRVVAKFPPGRLRALADFRATFEPGPVQLAGDYLYGPWMESAALSGRAAAERVVAYLA
jgi:protoporphyrinogen/coproporphyrinogen III oxidase